MNLVKCCGSPSWMVVCDLGFVLEPSRFLQPVNEPILVFETLTEIDIVKDVAIKKSHSLQYAILSVQN